MTAIILAGGKATRMAGRNKAFLIVNRQPLIKRQLSPLRKIFKKIIIVSNDPKEYDNFKDVKIVPDVIKGLGPLGGIYSGLMASKDKYNFVIACDMPFISAPFVRYMIDNIGGYDVMVPKVGRKFHPLFGIYSKNCISAIEGLIKENNLKVAGLFSKVKTRFLSMRQINKFDKDALSLININTPEELNRLKLKGSVGL